MELLILKNTVRVLMTWFLLLTIITSVSATPIILEQSHHTGILEIHTYDEIKSSGWLEECRTNGLSRILSENEVGREYESTLAAVRVAAKTGSTVFRSFTKSNYRYNLQALTGKSGVGMDAHHIFPQASRFQAHWNRVGLNIHNPKNLTWWSSSAHRSAAGAYNKA